MSPRFDHSAFIGEKFCDFAGDLKRDAHLGSFDIAGNRMELPGEYSLVHDTRV